MARSAAVIAGLLLGAPLAACTTPHPPPAASAAMPAPVPANPLAGTRWQLVQFGSAKGGIETPEHAERYVIELMADGHFAAQVDCNRAVGQWHAAATTPTGGAITITAPAMTRAMCLGPSWDDRLARAFGLVRSFTLDGDRLGLVLEGDAGVYEWRRLAQ